MSIIRADSIKNRSGAGAPDFPNGITVTGVVTATVLDVSVPHLKVGDNIQLGAAGIATATSGIFGDFVDVGSNIKLGNAGVITATTFVGALTGNPTGTLQTAAQPNITSVGTLSSLNVSGNVSIGGTLTYEDITNIDSVGLITAREGIFIPDSKKLHIGNTAGTGDLQIHHNGSDSYIDEAGTGRLLLRTSQLVARRYDNNNELFTATAGGSIDLYHNGSVKLATSNTGVTVTGTVAATSYTGDGSNLTGIDATKIQTGNTKVETSASSISNVIGNAGIATITAQGLNVTGIVTATSMKVFDTGIDYEWQGGTSMAWWKSEDIVSTSSWPAAKGGTDANLVSHNGGTTGLSVISSHAPFNNHKCIQQNGNNTGGLRTSNQTSGYWYDGSDAFTVLMVIQKDAHQSGANYGDSYFVHNVNTNNASNSWSIGPYGDHTWGGQYGEMWGGIQNYFEGLEQRFSYPWRGLFMIRMLPSYSFGELSVNGGSGWQRLDLRHVGPSGLGSTFRGMSIFTNSNGETGHTARGKIAEWAYWKDKRLGGNELDAITKSWCNKFNL